MALPLEERDEALKLLEEINRRESCRKLFSYNTYEYQRKFCDASKGNSQKALMAANRIGKSDVGAYEAAVHATGEYPKWWEGRKWDRPVTIVCGGKTNLQVKDVAQTKLLGEPSNPSERGTGFIPLSAIGKTTRKAGVPDSLSSILVKHKSGAGFSKIVFLPYEAGKEGWMGFSADFVWLDEEPPRDIYGQALRSTVDRGGVVSLTFTPENGITDTVYQFTDKLQEGQMIMNATWDDAPHITDEVREQILSAFPEHERAMRSKGTPMLGEGQIFPVLEDDLRIAPFEIPPHWKRIGGLDFGWGHPTAWVSVAYDADSDVVYITDEYRMSKKLPSEHTGVIKRKGGNKYPTAWPHDGLKTDPNSGRCLRDMYKEEGLEMLREKFSNPPATGKPEGSGGNSVEAGLMELLARMRSGRFKVFSTCTDWFEEVRMYHRKDGKVVDIKDDLMSATRYAVLSLRHARSADFVFQPYIPKESDFGCVEIGY